MEYFVDQLLHLPYNLYLFIMGIFGLGAYPRSIVRICPEEPAFIGEETVSEWIWKSVPSLKGKFKSAWWLPNGHFQTIYSVLGDFTKVDIVEYKRTYLRVPDGGTLALDFAPKHFETMPATTPTMVVCHGLTGGSHESYVRNVLKWATEELGVRAVVVNFRGCAGTTVTSPQLYSAGTTIDLNTSLHYLRHLFPESPLHGIGFSLGASVIARYLGESSSSSLLSTGVILGCPWSLPALSDTLENNWFRRKVYSSAMAENLLKVFFSHYDKNSSMWETMGDSLAKLKSLRGKKVRLKDVDNHMVAKVGGPQRKGMWPFKDADEYYEWARADRWITRVKTPLLSINANDDPIVDVSGLPYDEIAKSSHVFAVVTGGGGHLGWFDGPLRSKSRWILKPVQEYWRAGIHLKKLGEVETRNGTPPENVDSSVLSEEAVHGNGWAWVDRPSYDCGQAIGWRVMDEGEVVQGGEDSGALQGL